jgi:hypothetical protein
MPERIENATVVSMRRDRKGFKLEDDSWYSSFTPIDNVNMGDIVTFNYAKKGAFNNIKGDIIVSSGGGGSASPASAPASKAPKYVGFPVPTDDKGRAINRQSAVAQAIKSLPLIFTSAALQKMDADSFSDHVIDLARRLEAYTTGDLDTEIGKALAAEAEADDTDS